MKKWMIIGVIIIILGLGMFIFINPDKESLDYNSPLADESTGEQVKAIENLDEPDELPVDTPSEPEGTLPETEIVEQEAIEPGLIAHWTFDSDATDIVNEYEGTLKGGASFQTGKINNAIYLDGVDDYVQLSDEALNKVGSLSQGTISFWFNYESILDKQTVMPIFYIGNKQENPDNMYVIEIGHSSGDGSTSDPDPNDKKIYSTWIKNNREPFLCFDSGENMKENIWHHYVVVVGPDGNQGYIDGRLMENTDHNFGDPNSISFLDSIQDKELFLIGYGRNSFMISPEFVYYKGMVDDLRIYDRPLEWIEVQKLYNPEII